MKKMGILVWLVLLVMGCSSGNKPVIQSSNHHFILDLKPGEYYKTTTWWGIFVVDIYPQVAVWVESPTGEYLGTLYVTAKGKDKAWISAPAEGRPEALPVWTHLTKTLVDGVSGPTPSQETTINSVWGGDLVPGEYVVKLEANRSYDFNQAYPEDRVGVVGQPSVIYEARVNLGSGPQKWSFQPVGTGAVDGLDGKIRPGIEGIDTALKLFSSLLVGYE